MILKYIVAILCILTAMLAFTVQKLAYEVDTIKITADSALRICKAQSEHFKTCSFISKDDIGIGYDSYLYSKYDRILKKRP